MATMNVSLPNEMKTWVEFQAQNSGRYTNTSDYVRDLIRKDQDTNIKIQQMQAMVTKGLESSVGSRSMEELAKVAVNHFK
jgi:antitoxin ParD1/3/4